MKVFIPNNKCSISRERLMCEVEFFRGVFLRKEIKMPHPSYWCRCECPEDTSREFNCRYLSLSKLYIVYQIAHGFVKFIDVPPTGFFIMCSC